MNYDEAIKKLISGNYTVEEIIASLENDIKQREENWRYLMNERNSWRKSSFELQRKEKELKETAKKEHELLGLYQELAKDLGLTFEHDTSDVDNLPVDFEYLYVDTESLNALETFKKITELESELK
jgi:hypothetical protein